ncbi:chemotaxis protein CheV [Shewanella fodinae]|jgi:two-component system chemotaxis response regulator CheV|uniref:Response regulator receiver modulated CheW protein n=1 Tax=Shewanella fodinae TaxID=552357 RepID=A0A4R2FGB4_9GAMM|nr:chemotaxis protein CheV [Shewanella fodinae]TCN90152.1 response regulator receiver modulated CheW protein [Shewanella fodinae]
MANILESVDQHTQLVGENRLELLLFRINSTQLFAINVFKVKEVVKLPRLSQMPGSHPCICGVANIRGTSIPVINLRQAIGFKPMPLDADTNLIITEYNRSVQGFLVGKVEHIVNMNWNEVMPPPQNAGHNHYLTAITKVQHQERTELVSIIDVEKVLAEIIHYNVRLDESTLDEALLQQMLGRKVLIVDDSPTARHQVRDTLGQIGLEVIEACDGQQALDMLQGWCDKGLKPTDEILMMITDAEMPKMDGYRLTHEIRSDKRMTGLFIVLNTSLSGSFNHAMVEKVGCDRFISKFQPDLLVETVQERMRQLAVD